VQLSEILVANEKANKETAASLLKSQPFDDFAEYRNSYIISENMISAYLRVIEALINLMKCCKRGRSQLMYVTDSPKRLQKIYSH
jgi:hypothetical protein